MANVTFTDHLTSLRQELTELSELAVAAESAAAPALARIHPEHAEGARNLLHYVALRSRDLRALQDQLTAQGLSSLGRMESDVLGNLGAVLRTIDAALGSVPPHEPPSPALSEASFSPLRRHTAALLGGTVADRRTRIMVTMPSEAADDSELMTGCVRAGMDVARINCAHDEPGAWERMAAHARQARTDIAIAMDLAGPKVRTGPMPEGPHVVKVTPTRDALGRVLEPARVWLVAAGGNAPTSAENHVGITEAHWVAARREGDTVQFTDTRGRTRYMTVVETRPDAALLEGDRTAYIGSETILDVNGHEAHTTGLPPVETALRVFPGDVIELHGTLDPASSHEGRHRLGCTLPEVLTAMRVGDRVIFDDGKIEGHVRALSADTSGRFAEIEVTLAAPTGTKLRAEKGINLPDTDLPVPALTSEDLVALDEVVRLADIVQLSFARSSADIRHLLDELDARNATNLGVVVKIETVRAFKALPEILLELMQRPRVGVMIARGDLGVEAGWERLAEVQEEILWLCEAAQIPVIWATQVLDSLADSGVPTRAEVTDAAAGERAECVMLNKGPHIQEAIASLDDILRRMHGHVDKKRPLLRRLRAWTHDK